MVDELSVTRQVSFLDVFAEEPLAGNGLAVVDSADLLAEDVMHRFARETRLSETAFVLAPEDPQADYRVRIWTPAEELPFAGHPSLGTAVAVARWREVSEGSFTQQTGAGLQPIEVRQDVEVWRASMRQAPIELGEELDRREVMAAVGLELRDADPELPPQLAATGLRHLIAPVASAESLARVNPDYDAIDRLLHPHDAVVLYLAFCEPGKSRARARGLARMREVGEDPATGSAVGPLCAYLAEREGVTAIGIEQGEEMFRPSRLEAEMDGDGVRVSGAVVPLIDGTLHI